MPTFLWPAIQKCKHRLFHSYPSWNDQNQLSILIINFVYKFQIKLYNFSIFWPSIPAACKDLERNSKERNCYWPIVVPIDTEKVSLIERIAAENKYLRDRRENKQIIPSLIHVDFMSGRFYIVILFTKQFRSSANFAFQTRSQSICTE